MGMTRSENMARVKSKNTACEMVLRRELWSRGLRYRVNDRRLLGKPDIVFRRQKVAIFVDSEFWHGKDYMEGKNIPTGNREFWVTKLQKNIERDKTVTKALTKDGWQVIRIWVSDLKKNVSRFADIIEQRLK